MVLGTTDGFSGVSVQLSAAQSGAIELRSSVASPSDTTSLTHPGQPGSTFVDVEVADGVVVAVRAPGDDFSDI